MEPVASMISSAMLMQVQTFKRGKRVEAGMGEGRKEGMEALSSEDRGKALNTGATFWCLLQPRLILDTNLGLWALQPPPPRQADKLLTGEMRLL